MTTECRVNSSTTLRSVNVSGYVGHATILVGCLGFISTAQPYCVIVVKVRFEFFSCINSFTVYYFTTGFRRKRQCDNLRTKVAQTVQQHCLV